MCECSQSEPTGDQLEHAIKRNFGGQEEVQAYEIFKSKFPQLMARSRQLEDVSEEVRERGSELARYIGYNCYSLEWCYILTVLHWG